MAETTMQLLTGEIIVRRPHTPASSPLRAWSAADQLVLEHLGDADLGRVLIVNDEFGAITCALARAEPIVWTDSALSRAAIARNLAANDLAPLSDDRVVHGHRQPQGQFDTVVVRIPKTTALLDYQLRVIAALSTAETKVVGTGMVRHIRSSTVDAFEQLVGPTTTSRATRKARLIHTSPTGDAQGPVVLETTRFTAAGLNVVQHPGTFSAGHIDIGSALLLEVLRELPIPEGWPTIVDLGCGNGVLAAAVAALWHDAQFVLLDVSDLAVAAATETWDANNLGDRMTAQVSDGFKDMSDGSIDMVITNPPFHQGHALDSAMTDRLLAAAARVLQPGGTAYVVAQRHENLHTRMLQWFTDVEVVSKHPSHVVLQATTSA